MFQRLGKRKMSADETGSQREKELRQTVAQLRQQVEEEKSAKKRAQYEKVREVKAAREKEQDIARETIDNLKIKQQREKAQEMDVLQERMTKDFKTKMKENQRTHEEEKQKLQKELEKERQNSKERRKIIEKEVKEQVQQSHEAEQKKLIQEMFMMDSKLKEMEEKLRCSQVADRTKAEVIRDIEAQHQEELGRQKHSSVLSSKQQMGELEASKREVKEREKDISSLRERNRRLEADKERLEDEVRRLRRAESWARSSPTPTSPPLTPSASGDFTSPHQFKVKERDMVVKNSELSYRVRILEEKNTELEKKRKDLEEQLQKSQGELKPLKEQLTKQGNRVNSLNASLHDKEKVVKRMTGENEELKKANKSLEEEKEQQKKRLDQQMKLTHVQRMERQKAVGKHMDLQKVCKRLQAQVKELEQQRRLTAQPAASGSEYSPSISLTSLDNSAMSVDEGDADQAWTKYREMKREYVTMREHYKKLKSRYDKLEEKHQLAEQEKLTMEAEVSMLRSSPLPGRDSPFDMMRSSTLLSDYQQQLETSQTRIKELESFIIEHDKTTCLQREELERELASLTQDRDRLQEQLESTDWEREEGEGEEEEVAVRQGEMKKGETRGSSLNSEVLQTIDLIEDMNLKATATVKETKEEAKALGDYQNGLGETLQGIVTLEEGEEDYDGEGKGEEMALVLRKAQVIVTEIQELLSTGQNVSPAVDKLAALLAQNEPSTETHSLDNSLILATANLALPVDSSTPSPHTPWVAEIDRLKEELLQKQAAVHQAQEKVTNLQALVEELERRLEEEMRERESLANTWDQEMAALQSQLSQKESKLTRLRRGISQGINEHMHQQLGHQVLHSLQQCKSSASVLTGSEGLLSELCQLESSLQTLLHTVFPGMFQQTPMPVTPTNSPVCSPPPLPKDPQSEEEVEITPLSSLSNSTTHSQSPRQSPAPPLPNSPPPPSQTLTQSHSLPSLSQSPPVTPPPPVDEVMVMEPMACEELIIPLSALLETTPTDSTHFETHTPPKSPFQTSPRSSTHSTPEYPSSPPHTQTESLANPLANSPSHLSTPDQNISEGIQQGQWRNEQLTGPLLDAENALTVESANPFDNNPSSPHSEDIRQGRMKMEQVVEYPADLPPVDAENSPIEELANPFADSPSRLSTPEGTPHNSEDIQQEKGVEQLSSPLPDAEADPLESSPSHLSTPEETTHNNNEDIQEGREKKKETEKGIELASLPLVGGPIEELTNPFTNSPSHLSTPEEIDHKNSEEDLQEQRKQVGKGLEGIKQMDGQSINSSSHIPVDTIPDSHEKDRDEVDLGPGYSEQVEVERGESDKLYKPTSRDGMPSPPLPPEEPVVEQRVSGQTSLTSPNHKFGKKRLRTESMEWDEVEERESTRGDQRQKKKGRQSRDEERLFVAILNYDPEAMCSTGRPEEELLLHEGAILAVQGGVDENGFYLGSFEGKTGLVPANFVQEMEVEDSQQRKRLLNQTLSRPHLTSFTSPCTSLSSSRPTSASILSPSGTYSPFLHSTVPPPPDPPTSVTVESTREKRIVMVSWTPPSLGSKITGYEVYVDKHVKATVTASQNKVLLSDMPEDRPVAIGVVSHDQEGQKSTITSATYIPPSLVLSPTDSLASPSSLPLPSHSTYSPIPQPHFTPSPVPLSHSIPSPLPPSHSAPSSSPAPPPYSLPSTILPVHSTPSPSSPIPPSSITTSHTSPTPKPEQYRLCISLIDYDPDKMSDSEQPHLELKIAEGNLLRCYKQPVEDTGYTMAELGESNKRGLVPTEFITEVYGPSSTDPQKYEWKSPPQNELPATSKLMTAVYDYNSKEDSPNRDMGLELSFKNGDTITVYGGIDVDGFYCGHVGEAFGLVPSNFLQEEKKEAIGLAEEEKEGEKKNRKGEKREDEEVGRRVEKWDIPPDMWRQEMMNQHETVEAVASRSQRESDSRPRKGSEPDDLSGSGSLQGSTEGKKRRSRGLPRPKLKNPFTRKKNSTTS